MWADWIEAVLTRAGFRVLPRSTVMTAGERDGDVRGSIQAERELQVAPRGHRRAFLRVPAFARRQVHLEDAVVGRRRRHAPPADPGPDQRGQDHRAVQRASGRGPGPDGRGPGDREAAVGAGPARAAAGEHGGPGRGAAGSRARSRRSGTCRPGTPTSPAAGATLELLRDKLAGGGRAVVVAQALYGLGGVGKTQLALEYAHRFMADYDLVWWVPSERAEETSAALADLARKMGLKVGDNVAEAAEAALEELRRDTTPHWLLIFDNADDPKQLEPYLPTGSGHVLITSRNQAWTHSAEPLEVDVFTRDESVGAPAAARARPGRRGREAGRRRARPPAAGGRAGQRVAGADRDARPGCTSSSWRTQSTRILALNQPTGLPDAGRGDLEPVLRPAEAAVAGGRPAAAAVRVLLARAHLDGPALQRRDERVPAAVRRDAEREADARPGDPGHQPVRPGQGGPGQQLAADPPAGAGGDPLADDRRGTGRGAARGAQDPRRRPAPPGRDR